MKDTGSIGESSIGSSGDFGSTLSNVAGNIRTQFQPAIDVVQQGIPALQDRFTKLIGDIKGERDIAVDAQSMATRNELARRGILSGSGIAEQEQAQAIRPITQRTSTQLGQLGVQQEGLLQNIRDRLAGLLTQPATLGVNTALNLLGQRQAASQFDRNLALQQAQQALQQRQLEEVTLPQTQANIGLTNAQSANIGTEMGFGDLFTVDANGNLVFNVNGGGNGGGNLEPPPSSSVPGAEMEWPQGSGNIWRSDGQGGWY